MRNKIIVFALLIAFTATVWIMPNIAEAGTTVNVSSVSALQSAHPYSDQMDKTWVYTHSVMADKLEITFSTDTQTESGYDYIYIYDGTGNQVGKYDGTNLAGKTITVSGSSVKIRLTSDSSQTKYGFRVTQIIAINEPETGPITSFANTGATQTSLSFSFPEPKEATSVVLEYSTDGDIWNVAPTGDLTADSTSATVGDLEFGKKYWFRLNVVGGTREGISNVLELIMGYSTEADFSFSNGTITKYNGISPFVLIPETIGGVAVTKVGNGAFSNCSNIVSLIIPESITSIGNSAFSGCTSLTSITIPESVTSIGGSAFYNCTSLTTITIPESVTSIGGSAFYNCTSLEKINYNAKKLTSSLSSSNNVLYNAGNNSTGIDVVFGDSVEEIPSYLFYVSDSSYAPKIKTVTMGCNVTSIGSSAFSGCTSLESITIPDSVTSIGYRAFDGCSSLTSITIPDSVTSIGEYAFRGCSSLERINYNAKKLTSSLSSSNNVLYNAGNNSTGIDVVFGDSVEEIPSYLFYVSDSSYAPKIKTVTMGCNVTSIGSSAFSGCTSLESITIPDSVTSIGSSAFSDCTSLTSITIPDSVASIGNSAFSGCTSLETINYNAKRLNTPITSSSNVFYNAGKNGVGIDVTFGDSVEVIPSYLFYVANSSNRPNIKNVSIGRNVVNIGEAAFRCCTSLESIIVAEENSYYCSVSGALISKSKDALILIPPAAEILEYSIPNSIKSIASYAFYGCSNLVSVSIPESVTSIGNYAFRPAK